MEAFRVRHTTFGQERSLLLPLSLGVSSLTVLHVLSHQLSRQSERTGRPGYTLKVAFICEPSVDYDLSKQRLDAISERYPQHTYSISKLPDVLDIEDFLSISDGSLEIDYDRHSTTEARLEELLHLLPSATSRVDVLTILRNRAIIDLARQNQCEAILWGDSTTRLAERTLAETAKGRGFSLPWQVTDSISPHGMAFHFPMRDLLRKEIVAHAEMCSPPLTPLIIEDSAPQPSASTKTTTIDNLMKQYFESVEENYPSIVANVVRTSSKLEAPPLGQTETVCQLCRMPVLDGLLGIHGWGGDQSKIHRSGKEQLCYGCSRAVPLRAATEG